MWTGRYFLVKALKLWSPTDFYIYGWQQQFIHWRTWSPKMRPVLLVFKRVCSHFPVKQSFSPWFKFHLLLRRTILLQLLVISPCYHPFEAKPMKRRQVLDNVNTVKFEGEEATILFVLHHSGLGIVTSWVALLVTRKGRCTMLLNNWFLYIAGQFKVLMVIYFCNSSALPVNWLIMIQWLIPTFLLIYLQLGYSQITDALTEAGFHMAHLYRIRSRKCCKKTLVLFNWLLEGSCLCP